MRLKVSLAQINPKSGDITANREKIIRGIDEAKAAGCDLVVFPEMCLTGYCLDEKLLSNREFLKENRRVLMEQIVPASQGIAVIVGFLDFDEGRSRPEGGMIRYNAAAIAQDGKLLQVVHKRLLPSYRYFDDKRYFTAGQEVEPILIQTSDGKAAIGVLICEDLWEEGYEFKPCAVYREKGVEYLFAINASPFVASTSGQRDGKRFKRAELIQQQIRRLGVPIVYLNTVGVGDNGKNVMPFDGMSVAYGNDGQLVAALNSFQEDQQTVCFEGGRAEPVMEPEFDREAEIFQALVMAVRDYYDKVGIFQRVLEAVSGGIDSALGAAIACEAVGRERLSLYNLPSRYNSEQSQTLARQLAENLKLEYHVIPIQKMVDQVVEDFEEHLHPIRASVTVENLQARIRGLIMMAESNDQNALLLSNGNETEIALGYTTLYGDMVGGLSVIGDLSKPDVYRLSHYFNRQEDLPMIPEGILEAVPSAELSEGQVDPFDYQVVGPVVSDFVEKGLGPKDLLRSFKERRLDENHYALKGKDIYQRYSSEQFETLIGELFGQLNRSVYKRLQGAPIVAVSDRAFGFDLRETIINGWNGG
ncbi:MAG: NAD(+) synthase [Acidobacteriota bacterium]